MHYYAPQLVHTAKSLICIVPDVWNYIQIKFFLFGIDSCSKQKRRWDSCRFKGFIVIIIAGQINYSLRFLQNSLIWLFLFVILFFSKRAIAPFCKEIWKSIVTIDGAIQDPQDPLAQISDKKKGKGKEKDMSLPLKDTFDVDIFIPQVS